MLKSSLNYSKVHTFSLQLDRLLDFYFPSKVLLGSLLQQGFREKVTVSFGLFMIKNIQKARIKGTRLIGISETRTIKICHEIEKKYLLGVR